MTENISKIEENKKMGISKEAILRFLKANILPTCVLTAFWMFLGWVRAAGIQWAILWPLNFLTGALNGLRGSVVGGTLGKTILLILFNSVFRGMISKRGTLKKRISATMGEIKSEGTSAILAKIPQYSNLKTMLKGSTPKLLGYGGLGVGTALLLYPFITGDGSLVNSMVCVALFLNIGKQLVKQRGFLISLINILLEKSERKTIDKDLVNRVIAGFTVGMAAAVPIAAVKAIPTVGVQMWRILTKFLPILFVVAAIVAIFWDKKDMIKIKKGE